MATEQPKIDMSAFIDALQPDETPFTALINSPDFVARPAPPYVPPGRLRRTWDRIDWWLTVTAREWLALKIAPWLSDR